MNDIEIISKYVVMVECPHCEGSGNRLRRIGLHRTTGEMRSS